MVDRLAKLPAHQPQGAGPAQPAGLERDGAPSAGDEWNAQPGCAAGGCRAGLRCLRLQVGMEVHQRLAGHRRAGAGQGDVDLRHVCLADVEDGPGLHGEREAVRRRRKEPIARNQPGGGSGVADPHGPESGTEQRGRQRHRQPDKQQQKGAGGGLEHAVYLGTGTCSRICSRIVATVRPSISAPGASSSRWPSVAGIRACTSSGIT